jgi:hypothetical protein
LPAPESVPERPPAYILPPVDSWTTAGVPSPDPLLDRPGAPLPGPFFNVETNLLGVHFRNQLQIAVPTTDTQTDTVQFPGPRLNDTVSPRFEVGYRLADGWGDLLLSYRFLCTQGNQALLSDTGPAQVSGQVALNSFDFNYAAQEFALGPAWEMRWRTGIRATIIYYGARLSIDQPASDPGTLLAQREVNYFWGLGPCLTLELSRATPIAGLSVFGRIDDSLQFGHITQTGIESLAGGPGVAAQEFQTKLGFEQTTLQTVEEVGLSYTVPGWNHSRFLLGYHFETYFQLARINFNLSRGQLDAQGLFLRAEINF